MKMSFPLCVTLLIAISPWVRAQDSTGVQVTTLKSFETNISIGYMNDKMPKLNKALNNSGYHALSQNFITSSVGLSVFGRRAYAHWDVFLFNSPATAQENSLKLNVSGWGFGWAVGYSVIDKTKFRLYPYIGLSVFEMKLNFKKDAPTTPDDGIFSAPMRESKITFSNTVLDLGFQADKIFGKKKNKWDCPQNTKYWAIGVRLGYYLNIHSSSGDYYGKELSDLPHAPMEGPYAKVVFSSGKNFRRLKWK
jgi:hypothetical protein